MSAILALVLFFCFPLPFVLQRDCVNSMRPEHDEHNYRQRVAVKINTHHSSLIVQSVLTERSEPHTSLSPLPAEVFVVVDGLIHLLLWFPCTLKHIKLKVCT